MEDLECGELARQYYWDIEGEVETEEVAEEELHGAEGEGGAVVDWWWRLSLHFTSIQFTVATAT